MRVRVVVGARIRSRIGVRVRVRVLSWQSLALGYRRSITQKRE